MTNIEIKKNKNKNNEIASVKNNEIDKISEISTTDIKIEEIIQNKNKDKNKDKEKKVTFYPYITVEEIESYKKYNKEIFQAYKNARNRKENCSCSCLIV